MMENDDPNRGMETRYLGKQESSAPIVRRNTDGEIGHVLPWLILFRIVDGDETLDVQVVDSMLIGRSDPKRGVYPEVDLEPFNGYGLGVSRQHARIVATAQSLVLKDLGSPNGTYLNGELLNPGQEYPVRHGDLLAIGQLKMELLFAVVPTEEASEHPMQFDETPVLGTGKQILLIEANSNLAQILGTAFRYAGFEVVAEEGGSTALDLMTQAMPDAIVMNAVLPDVHPDEFIAYVREHTNMPIVMVATANEEGLEAAALEAGADAFMTIPISLDRLIRTLSTLLIEHFS